MSEQRLAVIFAAGGTGGHLFPALAVAERIRMMRPSALIEFVGTRGKMEERIVPQHKFPLSLLWIAGINRRKPLTMLLLPLQIFSSVLRVMRTMRRLKPGAAVCAGSYVSYPVGIAARLMKIPLVLMESNSRPGLVVRKLAPSAAQVHIAFASSKSQFARQDNLFVNGNPVRDDVMRPITREDAAARFGIDADKPTLLVFGGSLGARAINSAIAATLSNLRAAGMQVIWQTGRDSGYLLTEPLTGVWQSEFIDDMRAAYGASDLVVCRAGGTTLAELTAIGVPSVLVPYPHHADQHQVRNAEAMRDAGAAVMIREEALSAELVPAVRNVMTDVALRGRMREAACAMGVPDATRRIATSILALADHHG